MANVYALTRPGGFVRQIKESDIILSGGLKNLSGALAISGSGAVTLASSGSTLGISSTGAMTIASSGSTLGISSTGAMTVASSGSTLGISSTGAMTIASSGSYVDIDAAGGITLDSAAPISLDSGSVGNFTTVGTLTLNSSAGPVDIDAAGGITLDSAAPISLDSAAPISLDSGAVGNFTTVGTLTLNSSAGSLDLDGFGGITLDSPQSISLDAGGAGNFTTVGTLTLSSTGASGYINLSTTDGWITLNAQGSSISGRITITSEEYTEVTAGKFTVTTTGAGSDPSTFTVVKNSPEILAVTGFFRVTASTTGISLNTTSSATGGNIILSTASSLDGSITINSKTSLAFKDQYIGSYIYLSDVGNTALNTTSQSIVGAINEMLANRTFDSIQFNTLVTPGIVDNVPGAMAYNSDEEIVEVGVDGGAIAIGKEIFDYYTDDTTGDILVDGDVVSVVGIAGGRQAVRLTDASYPQAITGTTGYASSCIGMVTYVDGKIRVTKIGTVHGLNTLGLTEGMPVYVDPANPGKLTQTFPEPPNVVVHVGIVKVANASTGQIDIDLRVVSRLEYLSGVNRTNIEFGSSPYWNLSEGYFELNTPSFNNTGFKYPEDVIVTLTYHPANGEAGHYTVDLSGTLTAYVDGVLVSEDILTNLPKLYTAGLADGPWFLSIPNEEPLAAAWSQTLWNFYDFQVAIVYVDSRLPALAFRECHGMMDYEAHKELHRTIGTYRQSGGDIEGGTYALNSTTATDRRPHITECELWDEDCPSTLPEQTGNYARAYLDGASGAIVFATSQTEIVGLTGNQPYYNQYTGGSWTRTGLSNNNYSAQWLIALPVTADTESQKYRFVWLMGQSQGTLASQQALVPANINLGELSSIAPEMVIIAKVIVLYSATNWTIVQVDRVVGTKSSQVTLTGGSYLSTVNTDGVTIRGNGTSSSEISLLLPSYITTSTDGTTTLTSADYRINIITGTGINHQVSLPDATTLKGIGDYFDFLNSSSEAVLIKNSGSISSCYLFLMPNEHAKIFCTSVSSTAGSWHIDIMRSASNLYYDNDFISAYAGSNTPINIRCTIGTGSGYYVTGESYTSSTGGELVGFLGSDAGLGGYVNAFILGQALTGTTIINRGYPCLFKQVITVSDLSDGTNTYSLRAGFYDVSNGNAPANGIYFETDSDGDLIPTCMSSSSSTTIAAGAGKVGTAGTYSDLIILVSSASTRVDFWVNKVRTGSISTNIPKTSALFVGCQLDRSAGTTGGSFALDRFIFNASRPA